MFGTLVVYFTIIYFASTSINLLSNMCRSEPQFERSQTKGPDTEHVQEVAWCHT